jgi:DNA replication licensing factor MCM3
MEKLLDEQQTFHVTFTGEFGPHRVSPRQLSSSFLNQLVEVRGIVTRATLVRPKLVRSAHYCAATGLLSHREYRDVTSHRGPPTSTVYPTRDVNGNLLTTQFGLSTFVDHQQVTVQELPETAPPGQLPRSVEIILEGDLRDAAKPGDRISIVGVYKPVTPKVNATISGVFRALIVATGVRRLSEDLSLPAFTETDYDNITTLSAEPDVLDQLGSSLAPSIYGYSWIKKALVLLLAGGRERVLGNGTHLRGDINCLMVGDPGVAKSQLLRAVLNVSPICVSTTGRGSSGVGLTAAVVTDQETGDRRLEAGAMVLADRGVVCIDEFDKMNDADRVAIHEVMEQQTVTIAKAGILTQLNARCSVVAAANPIYGHYDRTISITRNIGLPDSLLSRFDLLFVVLDSNDAARDRDVANHVLGQHRFRPAGDDGTFIQSNDQLDDISNDANDTYDVDPMARAGKETPMRVKYDARLYGPRVAGQKDPLSLLFFKKYIAFAKNRFASPELTAEASESIAEYYAELRNSSEVKALPVTVRTLETVIRLSCAHAKIRLSPFVEIRDVDEVKGLMDLILKSDPSTQEVRKVRGRREDGRTKRTRASEDASESEDEESDNDDNDNSGNENVDHNMVEQEEDMEKGKETDVIKGLVMELGQQNSGAASITGISALLRERGMRVSRADIVSVLEELESQDKILMDGEDFYMTS